MKALTITFLIASVLGSSAFAAGSQVVPHKRRAQLLQSVEQCMVSQDEALEAAIPEARYPFEFKPVEAAPVAEAVVVKEKVYTDLEVLEAVAPLIKPSGTVVRDGKNILMLPNGSLPEGSVVKLTFRGKPYLIKVTEVVSDSYKLQLNDTVIVRSYDSKTLSGRATRD